MWCRSLLSGRWSERLSLKNETFLFLVICLRISPNFWTREELGLRMAEVDQLLTKRVADRYMKREVLVNEHTVSFTQLLIPRKDSRYQENSIGEAERRGQFHGIERN